MGEGSAVAHAGTRVDSSLVPGGAAEQTVAQKKTFVSPAAEAAKPAKSVDVTRLTAAEVSGIWSQAIAQIEDISADFARQATSIAISGPNRLAVRFRKAYTHALQFCQRPDRKAKLERVLADLAGHDLTIDFELLPDEPESPVRPAPQPVQNRRQKMRAAEKHPLVRSAIELFDAEVVNVIEAPVADDSQSVTAAAADEGIKGEV